MTRIRTRWQELWDELAAAFESFERAQRPWEQEGPLRWVKPLGGRWELHGTTLPDPAVASEH